MILWSPPQTFIKSIHYYPFSFLFSLPLLSSPADPPDIFLASRLPSPSRPAPPFRCVAKVERARRALRQPRCGGAGRGAGGWRTWRQAAEGGRPAGGRRSSRRRWRLCSPAWAGGRESLSVCEGGKELAVELAARAVFPQHQPGPAAARSPATSPGRAEPSWIRPGPCCSPCTVCGGTSPR